MRLGEYCAMTQALARATKTRSYLCSISHSDALKGWKAGYVDPPQ